MVDWKPAPREFNVTIKAKSEEDVRALLRLAEERGLEWSVDDPLEPRTATRARRALPHVVYGFFSVDEETPRYIGEAVSLQNRTKQHINDAHRLRDFYNWLVETPPELVAVDSVQCKDFNESRRLEARLISEISPIYNRQGKPDPKMPLMRGSLALPLVS